MTTSGLAERVEAVRRFNRFYTRQIGLLQDGLLKSRFSLTEARVLYELAYRQNPTATEIGRDLGLDAGYLSRILRSFQKQKLVGKEPSAEDGRQHLLRLTAEGRRAFALLDEASRREIGAMLKRVSSDDQPHLVAAMQRIEDLIEPQQRRSSSYVLRPHRPGDLGWIIARHGALYTEEYGWNAQFEAYVADVAAAFLHAHDPACERCWIAEKDGERVGSVLLVKQSKTVAKLRLLLVEPAARGLGLGGHLVEECLNFARHAGYRKTVLWTNNNLTAARKLYENAGFRLIDEKPHRDFGLDLVGETWELTLGRAPS